MQIASWKFWGSILVAFLVGYGISHVLATKSIKIEDKYSVSQNVSSKDQIEPVFNRQEGNAKASHIPDYVLETLEYILEHHQAPDGYVGGRTFQNREGILPKTNADGAKYQYKEWDVHPKVAGRNRGAERLVTSNENDAYYTSDHYRSFEKIK